MELTNIYCRRSKIRKYPLWAMAIRTTRETGDTGYNFEIRNFQTNPHAKHKHICPRLARCGSSSMNPKNADNFQRPCLTMRKVPQTTVAKQVKQTNASLLVVHPRNYLVDDSVITYPLAEQ